MIFNSGVAAGWIMEREAGGSAGDASHGSIGGG